MDFFKVKNLNKTFGGLHAVDDVTFDVKKNMIKGIIGPNGAGKTTLFNLISGSLRSDSGEVLFKDEPIQNLAPYMIAEKGISRTFQNIKLFPHMTVLENVMIGRHMKSHAGLFSCLLNLPWTRDEQKKVLEKSMELLGFFGISHLAHQEAGNLAFGMQRMVELARALATEPGLLLLDEPAAGLNIHETADMALVITKIKDQGITIIIIEHDMSLIMGISDDIMVLNSGRKITEGRPEEIQRNKEVIAIYLGEENA